MITPYSAVSSVAAPIITKEAQPLPSVKDAVSRLAAIRSSSGIAPSTITIWSPGSPSPESMPLVFLVMLHWMKLKEGRSHNGTIDLSHKDPTVMLACAKAYQKAVKKDPGFVSLWCRFALNAFNTPFDPVISEMNNVLAVIRGTYLLTQTHLSLDELGVFSLTARSSSPGKLAWSVVAERRDNRIATIFMAKGVPGDTIYDAWGAEESVDAVDMTKLMI